MSIVYAKNGIVARVSREEDIAVLRDTLRRKDAEELVASGFDGNEDALVRSYRSSSRAFTLLHDDVPVAMFGVVPTDSGACVWFLGSEGLQAIKKTFVHLTGLFIRTFLTEYPMLWNLVDVRYGETFRWLEKFGAIFEEPAAFGPHGLPFRKFTITRKEA